MDNFSYFHLCNHRIKKSARDGEITTIDVESGSGFTDVIINGAVVLELLEVRVLEYDPNIRESVDFYYDNTEREQTYEDDDEDGLYDQADHILVDYSKYFIPGATISEPLPSGMYEPTLHNRIRWSVKPPIKYQVKAKVKYTHQAYENFLPANCPVCGGKGWFIDILNKDGAFEVPTGIQKIAQRIVKDLLTEVKSQRFNLDYGTTVKKDGLANSADDNQLFDNIRMAVSDVENNYLNQQQNIITQLEPDEILFELITDDVSRLSTNLTIVIIRLRIRTAMQEETFQLGF